MPNVDTDSKEGEAGSSSSSVIEPPSPRNQNLFTTSGGDGLSFITGTPNIFDMIDTIKYGTSRFSITSSQETITDDEPESPVPLLNDMELTLEELPESIRPISAIVEIVQHLDTLKETLRPQS